ncbi:penicillin-binding protein 1A [Roseivirga echinicomitans]
MTRSRKPKRKLLKWTLRIVFLGIISILLFYFSVYLQVWTPIPNQNQLTEIRQSKASEVYASNGKLIGKFYIFDRQPINYNEIPQHLINALIATEDARFYEHKGIDQRSLLRVIFKSLLLQDESSGGGSTISQQLAKNLFPRKRYGIFTMPVNKTREAIIATRLEKAYTKEEIITLYLNTVPFGDNTFGIESAAGKFYSKKARELTLPESAVLIGMLKASHLYNPRIFPERSKTRRDVVLNQMSRYGYLTAEEVSIAKNEKLKLSYRGFSHEDGLAPYFREQVRKTMDKWAANYKGEQGDQYNLYTSGLKIYTTLDYDMQRMAEEAMTVHMSELQAAFEDSYGKNAPWLKNAALIESTISRLPKYKALKASGRTQKQIMDSLAVAYEMELFDWSGKKVVKASPIDSAIHYLKFLNTGMLSIDPRSGAVKTWIGGIDFEHFQYDHVNQAKRQVGSTFKPIVYTAALEAGIDPCKYYSAQQIIYTNYDNWSPTNSGDEGNYELNYSMKGALSNSVNTVAVKVLEDAGLQNVIGQAQKMGITASLPQVPSIALGTAEISLIEMVEAYSSYVNSARTTKPYFITSIADSRGEVIAKFEPEVNKDPAFSETTRQTMIEMLKATVDEGTASRLRWKYGLNNDIAGKTGTTQSNKDGWFVAITPKLLTITWVGVDDHRIGFKTTSMGQGANSALPIYGLMMQKMNADENFNSITRAKFPPPSIEVMNQLACKEMEEDGFLKRLFTNDEKPKPMKFDTHTEEKKEGIFSKIGNLFKRKDKKEKKKKGDG